MTLNNTKKFAVFTIDAEDFGDTGCVRESGYNCEHDMLDGLDNYIELLDKYGIKATLFTVCHTAETVKDKLKSYAARGHRIALHGLDHTAPLKLSNEQFREELIAARDKLESDLGIRIEGYRAPFFSMDNEKLEILRELGFRYDSSRLDLVKNHNGGVINVNGFRRIASGVFRSKGFYEFGLSSQKLFNFDYPVSGGGYLRLGNWGFTKELLRRYLVNNDYYIFYLHPFEFSDIKAPKIKNLKPHDKYYLNYGVSAFRKKVESIILMLKKLGYEFITFDEYIELKEKERENNK